MLLLTSITNRFMSDGNSAVAPPDSISNSEVKRSCGDGSVEFPCESSSPSDSHTNPLHESARGFLLPEIR